MEKTYRTHLLICAGTSCVASGSLDVQKALADEIARRGLEDEIYIATTGCNGFCAAGPLLVAYPDAIFYQKLTVEEVPFFVEEYLVKGRVVKDHVFESPETAELIPKIRDIGFFGHQVLVALRNRGLLDPDRIDEYIGRDGYLGTAKALLEMTPEEIVEEMKKSDLRGRGGAGFPTGMKWGLCAEASGSPKYILCNADEGDPGAFMDRSILESDPHAVLEGLIIGAKAVGAHQGYIYVRAEYPLAIERLHTAIGQAREYGLLGKDILGSGFDMDIDLYYGAGAFVCGEETALMRSIEGKRGMPRPRPPFPAQKGLWDCPTVLNNVETYANVPLIIHRGAQWYASLGTGRSKGTKVFALTGCVNNIGLIEVPMGTPLRSIVYDIGGGIAGGKKLKAVQIGGPSGGFLPESLVDTPVDFESVVKQGAVIGSGGMVVMDDASCMVDVAKFFLEFLCDESCGKCPPCRIGVPVLKNLLERITRGEGRNEDLETLKQLGDHIQKTSLCGLGQTAPNAVLSTIRHFADEYEAHIKYKQCPAVVCKEIISSPCQYTCPIDQDAPCYIGLIAQAKFEEAIEIVRRENPLPAVCGRVCDANCENLCRSGEGDGEAISIRALKRFLSDYEREMGLDITPKPKEKRKEKVAIVGSGPAGLTCAHYLTLEGYQVTVFESLPVAGGMLRVGIPAYRLPKDALDHDLSMITKMGVEIRTNTMVGKDIQLSDLRQEYQAVFVATGAHTGLPLGIDGGSSLQVLDAVDFLRAVNLGRPVSIGQRVAVIGGGNSAVDAASAARRLGKDVRVLYRRTKQEMPALPEEVVALEEEGIDVQFLVAPRRAVPGSEGRGSGLECIRMKLGDEDESGRRRPVPLEGSEFAVECDTVISAIGQKPEIGALVSGCDLGVTRWGTLVVDPETLHTGMAGVFAGGDVVTGPSAVTPSMGHGKIVARMIHEYLQGRPVERQYDVMRPAVDVPVAEFAEGEVQEKRRPRMPLLSMEERNTTFKEVQLGLTAEMAIAEAKRCLRCDRS